jgi:hypothetical protein
MKLLSMAFTRLRIDNNRVPGFEAKPDGVIVGRDPLREADRYPSVGSIVENEETANRRSGVVCE